MVREKNIKVKLTDKMGNEDVLTRIGEEKTDISSKDDESILVIYCVVIVCSQDLWREKKEVEEEKLECLKT